MKIKRAEFEFEGWKVVFMDRRAIIYKAYPGKWKSDKTILNNPGSNKRKPFGWNATGAQNVLAIHLKRQS